ncbi:MAG: alpha/beta hydrolase, partial [Gammaproteobacteria bacterium]
LISIAPPVNHFDFDSVIPPKAPWLIVQGTEDEVVPAKEVFDWFSKQTFPHKMLVFENTTHFFHGRLLELRERVAGQLVR